MPRRVIKQSDYEKIIKGVDTETFAQIVGRDCYCHESGYMREKALQSFPFKIVADEDYEKEAAIQAQKEAEFRAEIENGTCLNVTLWDRLLNPELSFAHQYAGIAINGISGIDLTKTEIGRQAIREIKEILNNDATFDRNMSALMCYYYGNNEEEKIDSEYLSTLQGSDGNYYALPHYEWYPGLTYDVTAFDNGGMNPYYFAEPEGLSV